MKVTTGKQIKLDHTRPMPAGACLVYRTGSKSDAPLMSATRVEDCFYVTGSSTPWNWPQLWAALNGGAPLELLALMEP